MCLGMAPAVCRAHQGHGTLLALLLHSSLYCWPLLEAGCYDRQTPCLNQYSHFSALKMKDG